MFKAVRISPGPLVQLSVHCRDPLRQPPQRQSTPGFTPLGQGLHSLILVMETLGLGAFSSMKPNLHLITPTPSLDPSPAFQSASEQV